MNCLRFILVGLAILSLSACTGAPSEQHVEPERDSLESIVSGSVEQERLEEPTVEENKVVSNSAAIIMDVDESIIDKQESQDVEAVFAIENSSPVDRSKYRALTTQIRFSFNKPLLNGSFDVASFSVSSEEDTIEGQLRFDDERNEVVFTPSNLLQEKTEYIVSLDENIMSVDGDSLGQVQWRFKTAPNVGMTPQETIDNCMTNQDAVMLGAINNLRSFARHCGDKAYEPTVALTWSCKLSSVAQLHTDEMVRNDYFSHISLDGKTVGGRASSEGYNWSHIAENLAAGQLNVQAVLLSWMEQVVHCKNIMSPNFTEVGGGFSESMSTRYRTYWAQTFAREMP